VVMIRIFDLFCWWCWC